MTANTQITQHQRRLMFVQFRQKVEHVVGNCPAACAEGRTQRIADALIGLRHADVQDAAYRAVLNPGRPAKGFSLHFHGGITAQPRKSFWRSSRRSEAHTSELQSLMRNS